MRRFVVNRWWAHVLALSLVLGSTVGVAAQGLAASRNSIAHPDATGRTYGDPDGTGGTARNPGEGGATPTWRMRGTTGSTVGDGAGGSVRWMGTLRFVWEIAKTRWLR